MNNIHPTALVSSLAQLGDNITVSPYAIINDDVCIGDNSFIGPHAVIYNGARIGKNVRIYQSASVAHIPQDLKFMGEPTLCVVGDNTTIHEFVTLHRGTEGTKQTLVGSNVLLMAYSHIAHDCVVGNNCIIANSVQIGGFVHIDDWAIIGGGTVVHQFSKIGKHSMISGGCRVNKDIPTFITAGNEPLRFEGLNSIGLRRRGFSPERINTIKEIYNLIYRSGLNVSQAKERLIELYGNDQDGIEIINFITNSTRGIIPAAFNHDK